MTSWNCRPGETGRSPCMWAICQPDRWPGLLVAQPTLGPSSAFPEGSWPSQECPGGCEGDGSGCHMGSPALCTLFTPTCSAFSKGGRPALFVYSKANLCISRFFVDVQPRLYMIAPLRSGQIFPPNEPTTAKVKNNNKIAKPLIGTLFRNPVMSIGCEENIELANFMISCPPGPQT